MTTKTRTAHCDARERARDVDAGAGGVEIEMASRRYMNQRHAFLGMRAALVASVVLLTACDADPGTPLAGSPSSIEPATQTTSPTGSTTTSPTGSTTASPTTTRAAADYKLLFDEPQTVPLAPGTYALTANGLSGMPLAVIDAPRGFTNLGGWSLWARAGHRDRFLGYWTVSAVDRDPCDLTAGEIDPGTSVSDLADALAAQKLTTTTKPVPVTVGGRAGLYLELTVPTAIDFATCGQGQFNVWVSDPGGGRYMQEPGQVDRLWILNAEGGRVVLNASALSGATKNQSKELTDMIQSVRFVKPN